MRYLFFGALIGVGIVAAPVFTIIALVAYIATARR
jgi:hypothetical protein